MEFRVLGPLAARWGERPVPLGGPQRKLLLAALLSEANRPLTDHDLLRALHGDEGWDPDRERKVVHGLRVQVGELRGAIGGQALIRSGSGYLLQVGPDDLDESVFARLAADARGLRDAGDLAGAADRIESALRLWRGEPLADVRPRPFVVRYAARLRDLRLEAEKDRSADYLAMGRHSALVPILRGLTADRPGDERLAMDLALALYRDGRVEEAASACRDALDHLRGRGLESSALRERQRAILSQDDALRWEPPPGRVRLGGDRPVPSQLPSATAYFTGRDDETARLAAVLDPAGEGPAVAAIAGKAGVGKTALALHIAHLVAPRFPDGTLYVNLQPIPGASTSPANVLVALLGELGVRRDQVPTELAERSALFRSTLAERRVLVTLDNATDEEQVRPLLPGNRSSAVLITSRRPLTSLDGRHVVLDVLDPAGAVDLLAKVAGEDRVAAQEQEATAIATLCGCLPLAVRIAGARLAARPETPLRWLRERLENERMRLDVLEAGDLEIRASVDLSYQELPAPARRAFRLLALPEVQHVDLLTAAALLDVAPGSAEATLEELADWQLVERRNVAGGTSYLFHDLLRLFARERLIGEEPAPERAAALERVLETVLACADEASRRMNVGVAPIVPRRAPARWSPDADAVGVAVAESKGWFDREWENVVTLVEQAGAAGFDEATWLISATFVDFFEVGGHWSGWQRTHATALAAARRRGDPLAEANMSRLLGVLHRWRGDRVGARDLLETSLALFVAADWPLGEAAARRNLGQLEIEDGRARQAIAHLLTSRRLYWHTRQELGSGRALQTLGQAFFAAGRPAEGLTALEASVAHFEVVNNRLDQELARLALGRAYMLAGRIDDAAHMLAAAEAFFHAEGHAPPRAEAVFLLGDVHARRGRDAEAFAAYDLCTDLFKATGDMTNQARALAHRGRLHGWRGEQELARTAWEGALTLYGGRGGAEETQVRGWLSGAGADDRGGTAAERVLDHFDDEAFIRQIGESEYMVRILVTWTSLLDDTRRPNFLAALERAVGNGALVQLLLLDPDAGAGAAAGARPGADDDVPALVRGNLHHLRRFVDALEEAARRRVHVQLYSSWENLAYYRWDARALVVTMPLRSPGGGSTQYEVSVDSRFAQFVEQRFTELWKAGSRPMRAVDDLAEHG
jgi:DNA-binding SARP family transcriptional activator